MKAAAVFAPLFLASACATTPIKTVDERVAESCLEKVGKGSLEKAYYRYHSQVCRIVYRRWLVDSHDLVRTKNLRHEDIYTVQTRATIDKAGNIIKTELIKESSDKDIDALALCSWTDTKKLPTPPAEVLNKSGYFIFEVEYSVGQSVPYRGM